FGAPTPALRVQLIHPDTKAKETAIARIDSGADITTIPFTLLEKLNLSTVGDAFVSGYDDPGKSHLLFVCTLRFRSLVYKNIKVIAALTPEVLIGLDILNTLHICLDGHKKQLEILEGRKNKRRQ
ncbi:retroviral-like aspartic protease family protein, partial [bacterium]|nr:retroviral-like aspartic protease family protein [bacterium]